MARETDGVPPAPLPALAPALLLLSLAGWRYRLATHTYLGVALGLWGVITLHAGPAGIGLGDPSLGLLAGVYAVLARTVAGPAGRTPGGRLARPLPHHDRALGGRDRGPGRGTGARNRCYGHGRPARLDGRCCRCPRRPRPDPGCTAPRPWHPRVPPRRDLRQLGPLESHLEGVLNNVVSVDKNRGWALTGGRNQVATFTKVLHSSNDGAGWREFISQVSASYYTADVGSVVEIGRQGRNGPLRGLYSVDPTNVRMTGIPEWPLEYFPPDSGMQQWGASDFFRVVSMPSTDERMRGVGRCAVSRALNLAKLMVAVYLHDEEQLGTRAPKGILVGSNISPQQWETAMTARTEMMGSPDEMEARYFGGVAVIVNSGPDKPDLQLVGLSQLPVGFDLKVFTDLLMYGYALAFGYDPREFWPVSGGQLGTALETETQHKKATGKGGLEFALAFQEKLQMELPETLVFEFEQRDPGGVVMDEQAKQAQATTVLSMFDKGQGVISKQEARLLLADAGLIPPEWTEVVDEDTESDTGTEADEVETEGEDTEETEEIEETEADEDEDTGAEPGDEDAPVGPGGNQARMIQRYRERVLESPDLRRAMLRWPREAIVRYTWPAGRELVLWEHGGDALAPRVWRGSSTSGNYGHAGRPGQKGGSAPGRG